MNNSKETSINLMSELFMDRVEDFINVGDYDTSDALFSEFVVDGIDPCEKDFVWDFMPNLCT